MKEEKTAGQLLSEELVYDAKTVWEKVNDKEKKEIFKFCDGYIDFLNKAKTEREAVKEGIKIAEEAGFKPLTENMKLKAGDKVYFSNRGKTLLLAVIGKEAIKNESEAQYLVRAKYFYKF